MLLDLKMTEIETHVPKIYRFKFSEEFLVNLLDFARIHRYDDPKVFREKWNDWIKENREIIDKEKTYLHLIGYEGDVLVKMYKSARYYFKNKSLEKTKPKKRRQYIGLDRNFLDIIDEHLNTMDNSSKPSKALKQFQETPKYQDIIRLEIRRLKNNNLEIDQILLKIKKTYKNRHYTKVKTNINE